MLVQENDMSNSNLIVGKSIYSEGCKDMVINWATDPKLIAKMKKELKDYPIFKGLCPSEFRGEYLSEGSAKVFWSDGGTLAMELHYPHKTPYLELRWKVETSFL